MDLRPLMNMSLLHAPPEGERGNPEPLAVSPYLMRPLRDLSEVCPELGHARPVPAGARPRAV